MRHSEILSRIADSAPRRLTAALLAAALCALAGCTQTEPGGGTENSGGIRLTGRVMGSNNVPVPGVVVSLSRTGLSDTTDALGRYAISSAHAEDESGEAILDTLRYTRNGQPLARVSVLQWVESLPDVRVIQRDVSGLIDMEGLTATRIEAVLKGDGIDPANPVTADFYYNALTGNYSGFLLFPPHTAVANYTVQINIYGTNNALVGQSLVVPFNSFAGNITVPTFSAGNSVPVVNAGVDTAVALGAMVNLKGSASDAFGGAVTKWEWSIGGTPFVQTSTADTSFSRPTHGAYRCILRVTDNDGNTAVDTVIVAVVAQGANWVNRAPGVTRALTGVVWAGTRFVAIGQETSLTSPDGITWTAHAAPQLANIVWTGKKLVATASAGLDSLVYTSEDGISWTKGSLPWIVLGPGGTPSISIADSTVIVSGPHSGFLARSEDHGVTWLVDTLPPTLDPVDGPLTGFNAYTRHAGRLVAVGPNGQTASSSGNGLWTRHTSSTSFPRPHGGVYDYTMTSIVSTGTHAVAVGYAGHVMRSENGSTWETPRIAAGIPKRNGGSTLGDLRDVVWTGTALVAVGNGFTLLSADGGTNWASVDAGTNNLASVAWNGTRLVAVGRAGEIVTSD
jgi:hypothetical protein